METRIPRWVWVVLMALAPCSALAGAGSPSFLSTSSDNPYGAILTATPCSGPTCTSVINTCSGSNCHDITNSCSGAGCSVPVYIDTQVPACLQDTETGKDHGCFPAGISTLDFQPSPAGSSLVLTAESGGQYLAGLFLSSAPAPTGSLSTVTTLPNDQPCADIPPAASICDAQAKLCTLQKPLQVTSSSPTNCVLPYRYPLDLNGYSLQGDANTQIYFSHTIRNSSEPHFLQDGEVVVTNVTVILDNLDEPAFRFTAGSAPYSAQFNSVTVYNGSQGISSDNVQLAVFSSSFNHSQIGVQSVQSGNLPGRYVHVFGSSFQSTLVGLQIQSDWPRDQFVTVWQENPYWQCNGSGSCYQDPVYSGPGYPPDFASAPVAPYTRTYSASSTVYYPSGIEIVGNLFANVGQYAANIENAKESLIASNQVSQFAGTAFRVFKSKNPTFNSNDIETSDTSHATIGIDLEYCDYQGVTHNQIGASTGIATHNYGGQFRNTAGIYYNQIAAYVGVEGVWDQVNTASPRTSEEAWKSLMVDDEVAGNNFTAYAGSSSPYHTPATSFANQVVANVPSIIEPGSTASYPIYPYDRIFDPFAQVYCGRNPAQRVNHFIPIIEAPPQCSLVGERNIGNSPTWIGNYYQSRMSGNVVGYTGPVRAASDPYPKRFYNIPVWMVSAPFNVCFYRSAASQYRPSLLESGERLHAVRPCHPLCRHLHVGAVHAEPRGHAAERAGGVPAADRQVLAVRHRCQQRPRQQQRPGQLRHQLSARGIPVLHAPQLSALSGRRRCAGGDAPEPAARRRLSSAGPPRPPGRSRTGGGRPSSRRPASARRARFPPDGRGG